MSQNSHCPYCGSAVEAGSEFCSNCGAALTDAADSPPTQAPSYPSSSGTYGQAPSQNYGGTYTQQPGGTYTTTTTYAQPRSSSSSSNGTIALILSILSCVGILPCIGGIIGIVLGNQAKKDGDSNGNIAVVLGWINVCLYVGGLGFYLIFFFFFGYW